MVTGEHKGLLSVLPFISFFSVLFVSGVDQGAPWYRVKHCTKKATVHPP